MISTIESELIRESVAPDRLNRTSDRQIPNSQYITYRNDRPYGGGDYVTAVEVRGLDGNGPNYSLGNPNDPFADMGI